MSLELRRSLFEQLDSVLLIDPHSHINPLDPASHTLADILGYHYYTELAHSAGLPKEEIEEPGLEPQEKVRRIVEAMGPLENTIQYSWFIEAARKLFGYPEETIDGESWESLYDMAAIKMQSPDWSQQVLQKSKIEAVFLTNDFDDPLADFDTNVYIPCLRTDDLVFHFAKPEVQHRLAACTSLAVDSLPALHDAIGRLFEHFVRNNARACAISLPPDFSPTPISSGRAATALAAVLRQHGEALESHKRALSNYIFWLLAEYCRAYGLPFDLMIGVNRGVYEAGVHQGRDLYDSRVSLHQYKQLFNAFPEVTFPISVLASVTNQELTSYAWIFPNVVTNGHWWYSNTPTFIEHDLAARLEAVPATKQIGYYSDMYKLEFGLPKFAMYKRILAKVLAERFVEDRGWSEQRAVELGTQLLRGNVDRVFMQSRRTLDPANLPTVAPPIVPMATPIGMATAAVVAAAIPAAMYSAEGAYLGDVPVEPPLGHRDEFTFQPTLEEDDQDTQEALTFAPPEELLPEEPVAWEASEEAVLVEDGELAEDLAAADSNGEEEWAGSDEDTAIEPEEPLNLFMEEVQSLDDADLESLDNVEFPTLDDLNADPPAE